MRPAGGNLGGIVAALPDGLALAALVVQFRLTELYLRPMLVRPFWFNEQWRVWYVSLPPRELLRQLGGAEAPMPAGWLALSKASTALLGNVHLAYRLPSLLGALVLGIASYWLARRRMGPLASWTTAALLLGNAMIFSHMAQVAPYTVDAGLTAAAVVTWLRARESAGWARLGWYVLLAACAVTVTPLVFVLAVPLTMDLLKALRTRAWAALVGPILAGAVAAAHLRLFVMRQGGLRASGYWDANFAPRDLAALPGFVGRQFAGFVPDIVTPDDAIGLVRLTDTAVSWLTAGLIGVAALGVLVAALDRRTRWLLAVLGGVLGAQLVASALRLWPFGFTRVNTFLLPLLYLLGALGAARTARWLKERRPIPVRLAGWLVTGAAAALAVGIAAAGNLQLRDAHATPAPFGTRIVLATSTVGRLAMPGDVALVIHEMSWKGWDHYAHQHAGAVGGVPPEGTLYVRQEGEQARARAFVAAHPGARDVWLFHLSGTSIEQVKAYATAITAAGYRHAGIWRFEESGVLIRYRRPGDVSPSRPLAPRAG